MSHGKFFVIEGSDGSGKGTQFALLAESLRSKGYRVATYDFPQYSSPSAYFVKKYLNGGYGEAKDLDYHATSMFFALDRFDASFDIKKDLGEGEIVLANRFIASNMAHQGQRIDDQAERQKYYEWIQDLEFNTFGTPEPDHNFVLLVPAETAQQLIDQKAKRNYTDKKRDLHEADLNHLKRAVASYQELVGLYPDKFTSLICTDSRGNMQSIDKIHEQVVAEIARHL